MNRLYHIIIKRFNILFTSPKRLYTSSHLDEQFNRTKQYHMHRTNIAQSLARISNRQIITDQPARPVYDKRSDKLNERVPLSLKMVYTICLWQPYFWLKDTYTTLIRNNEQLNLLNDDHLYSAAAKADILLFSSGGNYSVNGILEQIDLSNKYVVIISTYSEQEIRSHIKYRIDYYQNAYLVDSQLAFDQFIANILERATKQD